MTSSAWLVLAFVGIVVRDAQGFRIVNMTNVVSLDDVPPAVFPPYAKGFVGSIGDPASTFFREHINSGAVFNPEVPAQWGGVDAEAYMVVPFIPPSMACSQGSSQDSSWSCAALPRSHIVCGHPGTLALSSPTYEVLENASFILITVTRTGGGVGFVSVSYALFHITTSDDDASATAFYTSSQRLHFAPGVTSVTFAMTVHDNFVRNAVLKQFKVVLRDPSVDASIGNQGSAVVTILDDDPPDPTFTAQVPPWGTAGAPLALTLATSSPSASKWVVVQAKLMRSYNEIVERLFLSFTTNGWTNSWTPTMSGEYLLTFSTLFGTGLQGQYFANARLQSQAWGAVLLHQDQFYALILEYRHGISSSSRLHLQWQSQSVPLETVQNSYVATVAATADVTIVPSEAVPKVLFQGNLSGVAGQDYSFSFVSLDSQGNMRQGETAFRSELILNQAHVDVTLTYDRTSQRMMGLAQPYIAGLYSLQLTLNQVQVTGFPIDVVIAPSPVTGPRSDVSGSGLGVVTAASPATLTIAARDFFLQVRAVSTPSAVVDLGVVVDHLDGTYTATYTPRLSGVYAIEILVNKLHVAQSPYIVTVQPNQPYGPSCHYVSVTSNLTLASSYCVNVLNGQFSCTYVPTVATSWMGLSVTVNSKPIKSSPFVVPVTTGAIAASTCVATGSGLVVSFAGQVTRVNVQANDIFGNHRMASDHLIGQILLVNGTLATNTSVVLVYVTSGLYELSYQVFQAGTYLLSIQTSSGQNIVNSPFTITIYPVAADIGHTTAYITTPPPFVAGSRLLAKIEPRDMYGNPVNQMYRFALSPPVISTVVVATATSYTVAVTPTTATIYPFQPQIFLPGGGNVSVFKTRDWTGPTVLFQTSMPLGANYGLKLPPFTDTMRTFSVLWQGYISALYSELYTFNVSASGCQVRMMLNTSQVANLSKAGRTSFSTSLTAYDMNYVEIWLSKPTDAGPTKYNLTWMSLSQPEQELPTSAIYSIWRVTSLTPTFAVYPSASYAANFELLLPPTSPWVAGTAIVLTVLAKDLYGNQRTQGGDSLHALITGFNPVNPIRFTVQDSQDHRNGTYSIRIVCFSSGNLSLTLSVGSLDCEQNCLQTLGLNPFPIVVAPAALALESTVFTGAGLLAGVAGVPQTFTMVLHDAFSNVILAPPPSNLVVVLVQDAATSVVTTWTFDSNAVKVSYIPILAGTYSIKLQVGASLSYTRVSSEPVLIRPNVASASTSQLSGAIGASVVPFTDTQSFTIVLYDAYSNPVGIGGDHLCVTLSGGGTADVIDALDGTYLVLLTLPSRGLFEVTTLLMEPQLAGLVAKYFANTTTFAPELRRVDPVVNLTSVDTPKIEWTGFLLGTFTELFQFDTIGCHLYIDNVSVEPGAKVLLIETHLHGIRVESTYGAPIVQLKYSSARTPAQVVPSSVLFPVAAEILPRLRFTGV
ncbi:hypothetical protein DYB38_008159 [Aphanomyces astaci]|uniref:PA14 domain-containing protein n=1 Tax=Aphanomyces astaci TaxID=112090 RepID=A0A397DG19_APHAT|nr:hypothetical protein DYB38_008159 [Aphanomyces astaci]